MHLDKLASYRLLVEKRKTCHVCDGLTNPSTCADGAYDSDQIGPWSRWQGNLDSELMVVGQDWGDLRYFAKNRGHEDASIPTNKTLVELLSAIGFNIEKPTSQDSGAGVLFLTNAVLCLKKDGLQGAIESAWFDNCGSRFLRPTIEIVRPKVIVTLGERAYLAIAAEYKLKPLPFRAAVESDEGFELSDGIRLIPVYHCGARILNTHRPRDQQEKDWARVRTALQIERAKKPISTDTSLASNDVG